MQDSPEFEKYAHYVYKLVQTCVWGLVHTYVYKCVPYLGVVPSPLLLSSAFAML